jgi:hypothetical protein
MPLTGRGDSYVPAQLADRVLPVNPTSAKARKQLNYATHFSLGGCGAPPMVLPKRQD